MSLLLRAPHTRCRPARLPLPPQEGLRAAASSHHLTVIREQTEGLCPRAMAGKMAARTAEIVRTTAGTLLSRGRSNPSVLRDRGARKPLSTGKAAQDVVHEYRKSGWAACTAPPSRLLPVRTPAPALFCRIVVPAVCDTACNF